MLRSLAQVTARLLALAALALPGAARADSASLMAQAQAANPPRYAFAVNKGAEFRNTADNRSFTLWWQPSASTPPAGVIVALHGHGSYATDELYLWQPYAQKYGYAVLALQWWFGGGEATSDYYTPDEMYPLLSTLLAQKGVQRGQAMFIGYSRGSANSYAVAARDAAASGGRYFGLVLSNAGGVIAGYPPNQQIDSGAFGPTPYAGLSWAMYCGEKDPDPNLNGCPAMSAARTWVTKYGATVVLFIDDPNGDHGGFMTNSANVETALATYATVLRAAPTVPTGLVASAIGTTQVTLAWGPSSDYAGVTGYRVYRDGVLVASPAGIGHTDSGLVAATAYTYTVAACDAAGNCSAPSAGLTVTTAAPSVVLSTAQADCLFDWGEDTYATLLLPRRPPSASAAPYYYRYYAATGVYVGVSATDNHLYFMDAAGRLSDLGLAMSWATQAGCR